ncbi:MAG: ClpXP protease specificity-enhancing factor SspB [Kiloniellales bacterium]|jgi:hypothetical protein
MSDDGLKYDRMVEEALRGVVKAALAEAAEHGLAGNHHFYITFRTDHPETVVPDQLRKRYPNEMTIVLQHQFWGLELGTDAFDVTLSFADVPEHLTVPFAAVTAFADPSVRFGLQFGASGTKAAAGGEVTLLRGDLGEPEVAASNAEAEEQAAEAETPAAETEPESAKVVTLDTFRKK